jgi:hypothetical protein
LYVSEALSKNETLPTIQYFGFENIHIDLTSGVSSFKVLSTAKDSKTTVVGGPLNDVIYVDETQGILDVSAGKGNDTIFVIGLGGDATIRGNEGNDILNVDGRGNLTLPYAQNLLTGTRLRWSGGGGDDELNFWFTGNGTSDLDIFEDLLGANEVNIKCPTNFSSTVLSRENFMANIHNFSDVNSTVERINMERARTDNPGNLPDFTASATIESLRLYLSDFSSAVYFDDTMATTDVFGGNSSTGNFFRIGQLYASPRDQLANLRVDDPIQTTNTTKGFLSDGCAPERSVTINAGAGDDVIDILRNRCVLDLNGQSGDDR